MTKKKKSVSRQYKWSQKNQENGMCRICGRPTPKTINKPRPYCWIHGVIANERQRVKNGRDGKRSNSIYYTAMKEVVGDLFDEAINSENLIEWVNEWKMRKKHIEINS